MRTPARLALMALGLTLAGPAPGQLPPGYAPAPGGGVQDPATPVVRIQVRAPAHLAPGKPLVYRVYVTNTSAATANKVVVRHPRPEGVTTAPEFEPTPNTGDAAAAAWEWKYKSLSAGETKEITLTYAVPPGTRSFVAKAYVTFEHGQEVKTELEAPKVEVTKSAPERASGTEPIPVSVRVTNTGRVPVRDFFLNETISPEFEFVPDEESAPTSQPHQREWAIKVLPPGAFKVIQYRVRAKEKLGAKPAGVTLTTTSATRGEALGRPETATTATRVLTPALSLTVKGPPAATLGEPAEYVAEVTNTGNTTLSGVALTVDLPPGCRASRITNGGQTGRGQIVWSLPANERLNGPLGSGETARVAFTLVPGREGEQAVRVHADGGRGVEDAKSVATAVKGVAVLPYVVGLEPGVTTVGRQGEVTYTVTNDGTEAAKGVELRVKLPPEVAAVKVTPEHNAETGEVVFKPQTIPPGDKVVYTVTYKADRPGRAEFRFALTTAADKQPLTTTRAVTVEPANE